MGLAAACGGGTLTSADAGAARGGGGGNGIGGFGGLGGIATGTAGIAAGAAGAAGAVGAAGAAGAVGAGGVIGPGGAGGSAASGAGGMGGGAAGATGRGGGAGSSPACPGFSLQQDGVLDLDLRAVTVTGRVTLKGAALPDQAGSRGQILFRGNGGEASFSFDLGTTGAKTYTLRLPPGAYEVDYSGVGGACSTTSTSAMPCGSGTIARGVTLAVDGTLDLDVPVVTATGRVTVNGARPPDLTRSRGSLTFRATADPTLTASTSAFAATGEITYRLNLIPGTYDVVYNGDPAGCTQTSVLPQIPCNSGVVRPSVPVMISGALDVDVPMVRTAGTVTLDGTTMPDATANRGALSFAGSGGATTPTAPFGVSGPASYVVALIPGRYTVSLAANPALCGPTLTPPIPCLGGVLMRDAVLTPDGVVNVDIPAVTVTGTVTLNGQPLPTAGDSRGGLTFTSAAGGGGTLTTLGTSGPASYRVSLIAGTYDVDYAANQALCGGSITPALPCTGGAIARGVALTTDGVLDTDLQRVLVTGRVTVRGATMPAATANRGALSLVRSDGAQATAAPFGTSGEAAYALSLWPGVYDARLGANPALCVQGVLAPAMPCVGGTVGVAAAIQSDAVLDVDIPAVTVSGTMTLNGGALPAETADRGTIAFTRVAAEGGTTASFSLGTNAAPTYTMTVTAGNYLVGHVANSLLCAPGRSLPGVPCASQVIAGCGAR